MRKEMSHPIPFYRCSHKGQGPTKVERSMATTAATPVAMPATSATSASPKLVEACSARLLAPPGAFCTGAAYEGLEGTKEWGIYVARKTGGGGGGGNGGMVGAKRARVDGG